MKHYSRPIFADYLVKISQSSPSINKSNQTPKRTNFDSPSSTKADTSTSMSDHPLQSDAIIAVFRSGEVFLIPIDDNRNNYLLNPYSDTEKWFEPTKDANSPEGNLLRKYFNIPHMAYSSSIKPRCIGSIKFCESIGPINIEFTNDGSNLLIVYGLQHKSVPSIGVFSITSDKMTLIYADSLLAVSDITYSSYYKSLIFIPRLSKNSIGILSVPQAPQKYQPRIIPEILFAGNHLKRTVHLCPGGCLKWHALSISDEICPTIIAWHFSPPTEPEKLWDALVLDFLTPCYIQYLYYDQNSDRLGFIVQDSTNDTMNTENSHSNAVICVWSLENKHVEQYNLMVPNIDKIFSAKWARSVVSSEIVFTVSASSGYYEHQKDKIMRWASPIDKTAKFFCDDFGNRYYFDDHAELKIIQGSVFYEKVSLEQVESKKVAPYPLIHNYLNGVCESLSFIHMYRCAQCRRPLLYPLISESPEYQLENCYCSGECQKAHWPSFVAVNQPLTFSLDIDPL